MWHVSAIHCRGLMSTCCRVQSVNSGTALRTWPHPTTGAFSLDKQKAPPKFGSVCSMFVGPLMVLYNDTCPAAM